MEFEAVAIFVKVVETRSFSGAARLLKIPKTTVSGKIAALEKRLGVTLIHRTTRRLHVTEAGEQYFKHCVAAVRELDLGEATLNLGKTKPTGILRVTAPVDMGRTIISKIVDAYAGKYPEVEVELLITNRVVDLILEGVDIAIRAGELTDSTLIAKKLFNVQSSFWASPSYLKKFGSPTHPKELADHKTVAHSLSKLHPFEVSDGKRKYSILGTSQIYADDFETIKALVLLGRGIALLPNFLLLAESNPHQLVKVLPHWELKEPAKFWIVHPSQSFTSLKVRGFMDEVIAHFQQL